MNFLWCLTLMFYGLVNGKEEPLAQSDLTNSWPHCPIFLTISTISRLSHEWPIEINWGPCQNPPEEIKLFTEDPSVTSEAPQLTIKTHNVPMGQFRTRVKIGHFSLPGGWNQNEALNDLPKRTKLQCLPYYIASYNNGDHQTSNCLKIQPNWMSSILHLNRIPLHELFLPGTHCSGCYHHHPNIDSFLVRRFGFVQSFDVWTQLVLGIRFLDFSVGYRDEDDDKFWICNDGFFVKPLRKVLRDIREFAIISDEVVVVDFRSFPLGFSLVPKRHDLLVEILTQEFEDIAISKDDMGSWTIPSGNLTIGDIRAHGKYLVLTYNRDEITTANKMLWPSWKKFSTAQLQASEIGDYVRQVFTKKYELDRSELAWVFYGIQGIDGSYAPYTRLPSARDRAHSMNRNMTRWLSGGAWSANANAVAVDFFTSTNLIDIAVSANQMKAININNLLVIDIFDPIKTESHKAEN